MTTSRRPLLNTESVQWICGTILALAALSLLWTWTTEAHERAMDRQERGVYPLREVYVTVDEAPKPLN